MKNESIISVNLNTSHAREMLRLRFDAPEWALMEEVAPSTGGGTRYADALAINLWPSRGHAIYGFEIKVSRSDWLRELKNPQKTEESVFKFCNRWYIVAPHGVVKKDELPPTWGLFELRETCLYLTEEAPKLTPIPIDLPFFASLMRRGCERINEIANHMNAASLQQVKRDSEQYIKDELSRRSRAYQSLQDKVKKFEDETGLVFDRYTGPPLDVIKLAKKLSELKDWSGTEALSRLTNLVKSLESAAKTVRDAIEETGLLEKCQK